MKKLLSAAFAVMMTASLFAGCGTTSGSSEAPQTAGSAAVSSSAESAKPVDKSSDFDGSRPINVVSREEGSGTRGAFIELTGIEEKQPDGKKVDNTTKEAIIANKTDVVLTNVAGDDYAIGYVSLGSLNSTVKALAVDGAEATAENVKNGTYKIARPFNIATKGDPTGLAADFISFIMSAEGQEVVEKNGYIKVDDAAAPYAGTKPEGKLVIAGSSSVTPVMEKLVEAYKALNAAATIEVQQSDSTAGMTAAIDGTCDIGMASRELKDTEAAALKATAIANDGIAVITSVNNPASAITKETIKEIFTGKVETWDQVQ